jgi:hypothetical protein
MLSSLYHSLEWFVLLSPCWPTKSASSSEIASLLPTWQLNASFLYEVTTQGTPSTVATTSP